MVADSDDDEDAIHALQFLSLLSRGDYRVGSEFRDQIRNTHLHDYRFVPLLRRQPSLLIFSKTLEDDPELFPPSMKHWNMNLGRCNKILKTLA